MPPRFTPLTLAAALTLLATAPVTAQVIRFPTRRPPAAWVSLSAGVLQFGDVIDDGTTNSAWAFETAPQIRASVERARGTGASYGLLATYARPSLDYARRDGLPQSNGSTVPAAPETFDARATVSSLAALFRAGGGAGLHQVIEVSLGARRYSGFASDAGDELAPAGGDLDFIGSVGFGIGYTLGQRAAISLVQDADFAFHQRDKGDATGYDGGIHRTYVTRLGIRYGLGTLGRIR